MQCTGSSADLPRRGESADAGDVGEGGSPSADSGSGQHSVTLTWNASVTLGVTYDAYRSQGCTGTYTRQASGVRLTTWRDTAVTSGQTYCYVMTAVNSDGESQYSNSIQARVQ
jgi:hypothetical protein